MGDFDMGSFSTMMGSEAGLEQFQELMVGRGVGAGQQLLFPRSYSWEGKVGDRVVIVPLGNCSRDRNPLALRERGTIISP